MDYIYIYIHIFPDTPIIATVSVLALFNEGKLVKCMTQHTSITLANKHAKSSSNFLLCMFKKLSCMSVYWMTSKVKTHNFTSFITI